MFTVVLCNANPEQLPRYENHVTSDLLVFCPTPSRTQPYLNGYLTYKYPYEYRYRSNSIGGCRQVRQMGLSFLTQS
jgi:hypothetical protein